MKNFLPALLRLVHRLEDGVVVVILGLMVILPVAEILGRELLGSGFAGSIVLVQHLTLWIAFLGALLAAREGKLLSLVGEVSWLADKWGRWPAATAAVVSVAVCSALAWASFELTKVELTYPTLLMGPLKVWMAMLVLPVGFGFIALRLLHRSADRWSHRLIVAAAVPLLALLLALGFKYQLDATLFVGFGALLLAVILGAPIFIILGGAAILLFWNVGGTLLAIPVEAYRIVVKPTFPTIPLFTLAGYFLAEGGASKRLVKVFRAWFGWIPGGTPVVAVLVCAFFTSFTGGSGVTILALGGLLLPMLIQERYNRRFSIGLLTASGSLGLLFIPSLPVILYGVISRTPIDRLFLGGFVPGLILVGLMAAWGVRAGIIGRVQKTPFIWRDALRALAQAKWELLLPVLILLGLFGGVATLVETAALAALYAFVVEVLVYRDLKLTRDVIPTMVSCATVIGAVLIIVGVAMGLTGYLVDAQVPMKVLAWAKAHISSRIMFLLMLNGVLLLVGALMDIFSALIVVVPLIAPLGIAFGIDPVHLGIIFLVNMELGYLTPPVGMNLFLASSRFGETLPQVYRASLPYFAILGIGLLAITYIPALTLTLPRLLGR